jgi:hypothetical protein
MALQYLLTARGYPTTADGVFGSGTWPRLVVTVAQGSSDTNAVKAAQTQLNKYGANLTVDAARARAGRDGRVMGSSREKARENPRDPGAWARPCNSLRALVKAGRGTWHVLAS